MKVRKKKKKDKLCCENCGSTNVDMQAWVNVNTKKFTFDDKSDVNYCNKCETNVYLTTINGFKHHIIELLEDMKKIIKDK